MCWELEREARVCCVCDEGHVNYLHPDVLCQCQTETFYPPIKAVLPDVSLSVTLAPQHTHSEQLHYYHLYHQEPLLEPGGGRAHTNLVWKTNYQID